MSVCVLKRGGGEWLVPRQLPLWPGAIHPLSREPPTALSRFRRPENETGNAASGPRVTSFQEQSLRDPFRCLRPLKIKGSPQAVRVTR